MVWTQAQQKVIDTRNKNLLVSAAAGSGKTAVLVERIISMITEGEHPEDIDRLLVVTFTNAAAAEMRTRIGKAIDEKLRKEPDNLHLQKQSSLLQSAQITTIHSFCLNVIRNYFHRIDLDPAFKIAEESEMTLMKSDVIGDVLERWYEEGREDFHEFIESYSYSKSDAPIEDLTLQLYQFSMSAPWPKRWLEEKSRVFEIASLTDMYQSDWMMELLDYVKTVIGDLLHKNKEAMDLCNDVHGPSAYLPALTSDWALLERLMDIGSYKEYSVLLSGVAFERLSSKREEGVSQAIKDRVKELREEIKKGLKDLTNQYFYQSPEEMLKDLQAVRGVMKVLFELTLDFMEEFAKRKEEKNLIDFNDLEHFALKILVEDRDGEKVPTAAAAELSEQFDEILIDEYQDSNMVQETILKSISREAIGMPNRFMVGDVKQSIYKFRLAMPEIFMEKYGKYSPEDSTPTGEINKEQRIDLDKNFRSRKVVLDSVNAIFEQIMKESAGGINYDEAASLKYGGLYEETLNDETAYVIDTALEDEVAYTDAVLDDKIAYSTDTAANDEAAYRADRVVEDKAADSADTVSDGETADSANKVNKETANDTDAACVVEDFAPGTLQGTINERISRDVELLLVTEEDFQNFEEKCDADIDSQQGNDNHQVDDHQKRNRQGNHQQDTSKDAGDTEEPSLSGRESDSGDEEEEVYTKKELEARAVAARIKELVDPKSGLLLFDQKEKLHRPAQYRDIVILLRSMTGWSEVFVNILVQEGIPAYADTGTGYFQTLEIMTILNMLRIIDNPRQDIALTGVLYSPIVGLTTTELSLIRVGDRNESMYTAVLHYAGEGGNEELKTKLKHFLARLEDFRTRVRFTPIHELLYEILEETGYYYYISAMPGGDRRRANVDMLVAQAIRFEKGSYSGLFHFIRYMEKLHKYEVDFGEASISGEQDNTVRIMSIHKSKGLEFPVVFVAGMSKQFNNQDIRSSIVLHANYGVGPEYVNSGLRTRIPTLLKKVLQKKVQIENMGEELRVLYVAMTRAKEKLIMTGYLKSTEEMKSRDFSFFEIMSAKNYLDWVLPAVLNRTGADFAYEENAVRFGNDMFSVAVLHKAALLEAELKKQIFLRRDKEELSLIDSDKVYDPELKEEINKRLHYSYPYQKEAQLKVKMTVSELKKLGQFTDEEQSEKLYKQTYEEPEIIPNFILQKEEPVTGADRGTLYHKVLELLDLSRVFGREDLIREMNLMAEANQISGTDLDKLNLNHILKFINSNVAHRMRNAQLGGKLQKEKQFVIGLRAKEVVKDFESPELILIQGIIDVFFEEDGELVLLDYKSDIVSNGDILAGRYRVQLEYYKKALEQMLGMRVKDMIIYSLYLGEEIKLPFV